MFALQLPQQILSADQVIIENAAGDREQVDDERIAQGVTDADAFFPAADDVCRAQDGELLRHDRLVDAKHLLQFLHAFFALAQHLENADPHRVREGSKEGRFERLQFVRQDLIHIYPSYSTAPVSAGGFGGSGGKSLQNTASMTQGGQVESMSGPELTNRLRQSLRKLLGWAEAYQPKILSERLRYDDDLDEAEDLLEAADDWAATNLGVASKINGR